MLKYLLFIIFLRSSKAEYSDSFAREVAYPLAVDAYSSNVENCIGKTLGEFDFGGQYTVKCDDSGDTCSAFVIAHPSTSTVAIVFRGSVSNEEIGQEINSTFENPMIPFIGGGNVNSFFSNGFNVLWNSGVKNAFLSLRNKYPNFRVLVTGHSLGGAEAAICAGTLSVLKYTDPENIDLYTFGSPRTGDKEFADIFGSLVPNSFRVVHKNDLIPHLPLQGMGYTHVASEVWYNNDMVCGDPYVICNNEESFNCSDQVLIPDYGDHGEYYGVKNYGYPNCVPPGISCSYLSR